MGKETQEREREGKRERGKERCRERELCPEALRGWCSWCS